jgi:hypothetical protein
MSALEKSLSVIDPHSISVTNAKLPAVYESAKLALAECLRVDECADWANKAQALASYAKQADDDGLYKQAVRIRARAIRRCGELLNEIESATGAHLKREGVLPLSKKEVAQGAGLSTHQQKTAIRVANVPTEEFESAVESETPPTVTKLAIAGTKPQPRNVIDLKGRNPEDFKACTRALGNCQRFAEFAAETPPDAVVRGASDYAKAELRERAPRIIAWVQQLQKELR